MPVNSKATFNPLLTATAGEFVVDEAEYVGTKLFPTFPTATRAGTYPVWTRENLLNVPLIKERAPGGSYPRLGLELGEEKFATKDYGLLVSLDKRQQEIYKNNFDADRGKVQRGVRALMLNKEKRTHALATNANVPNSSPTVKWDDPAANIIGDVDVIREAIHDNCGMGPNIAVIPRHVFNYLKENEAILQKYRHVQGGMVTSDMIASVLQVGKIVIAGQVFNSAAQGQAVEISRIWGNSVVLAHVNSAIDIEAPTFARTFAWGGYSGSDSGEISISSYTEEESNSTVHRALHDVEEVITSEACGYHLSEVLS